MREERYILVIDSGNGGIFTIKKLRKKLDNENILFFKDEKNCPYGNKSKKQLFNITINNIEFLRDKYNIKAILLACNTLSTTILKELRLRIKDIPIVGVVPPINEVDTFKKTLVISTSATLKIGKINKTIKKNGNIKFVCFKSLAKDIDDNITNLNNLLPFLHKKLKRYKNYSNIMLGCTHYNLIKKQLRQVLNNNIVFYEGSNNAVNELKNVLKSVHQISKSNKKGQMITIINK